LGSPRIAGSRIIVLTAPRTHQQGEGQRTVHETHRTHLPSNVTMLSGNDER
jgi:hypothetical protein